MKPELPRKDIVIPAVLSAPTDSETAARHAEIMQAHEQVAADERVIEYDRRVSSATVKIYEMLFVGDVDTRIDLWELYLDPEIASYVQPAVENVAAGLSPYARLGQSA